MDGRREEEARSQHPEEGALGREAAPGGPADHGRHDGGGRPSGGPATGKRRLQKGERPHHEAPVPHVGEEPFPEGGAGGEIRHVRDQGGSAEGDGEPGPQAPDEGRERRDGRELREGRSGGGDARPNRAVPRAVRVVRGRSGGEEEEGRHGQETEGLQVGAPRGFHHQEGTPEIEDEDPDRVSARPASHPEEDPSREEIQPDPHDLRLEDAAPEEGDGHEGHLGSRRVDGADLGMIDPGVPGGPDLRQRRIRRGVAVGIHPLELDVTVPQIAKDVVRELRSRWKKGESKEHGSDPDDGERRRFVRSSFRSRASDGEGIPEEEGGSEPGREGGEEQNHPGKRHARPRPPGQGGEGRGFEGSEEEEPAMATLHRGPP